MSMWAHGLQGGRPEQGSHGERAGRGLPRATRSRWGALACARQHLPSRSGSRGCRGRPQQRLMQDPGLARWQWGWTQGVLMGWRRRRERDRQGGVPRRGPTWVAGLGPAARGGRSPLRLPGEGAEASESASIPAPLQVGQVPGAGSRRAAVGKAPRAGTSASEKV